jgi:hypothetical protein
MANQLSVNNQKWYELNDKLTSIKISAYEQKFEEIRNQFTGIDRSLYDLKTKIGIHPLNFRFNN